MALRTFPTLDRPLRRFFEWYSYYLVEFCYLFIAIPILLTIALSTGLMFKEEAMVADPVLLYTPLNAPSWLEKQKIEEHWPLTRMRFVPGRSFHYKCYLDVIVKSRDLCDEEQCNLLEDKYFDEIEHIDKSVAETVVAKSDNGTVYHFQDLCLGFSETCYQTYNSVLNLFKIRDVIEDQGYKLTYPRATMGSGGGGGAGSPIYLAHNLGGVKTDANGSIASVAAIRLQFFLRNDSYVWQQLSERWEMAAEKFLNTYNDREDTNLTVHVIHSESIQHGLERTSGTLWPKVSITFLTLIALAVFCSLKWMRSKNNSWSVDEVKSKPFLAIAGVITAGMGIVSGIGCLILAGYTYIQIVVVMPFLIVSIGVDDMFIMVAAWHNTDSKDNIHKRMATSLAEAAVSITITSLTDSLSFAIGAVTPLLAVRCFCAYASMCVLFNYLYQITFFGGFMVVAAKWEHDRRSAIRPCVKLAEKHSESPLKAVLQRTNSTTTQDNSASASFFRNYYGPFLLNFYTKITVFVLLVVYVLIAVLGCTHLQEGLEYSKLLLKSDPTTLYMADNEKYFKQGSQGEVVINSPPNLVHKANRDLLMRVVEDFESDPFVLGRNATQFWLREFYVYLQWSEIAVRDIPEIWVDELIAWSNMFANQQLWGQDLAWKVVNGRPILDALRFRLGLSRFHEAQDQRATITSLRTRCTKYPNLDITTFGWLWQMVDQFEMVFWSTIQNVGIALGSMVLVALFFIPNPVCTVWITVAIASIDLGVVGFMSWWGVNLDAISMITIIMSIGFSVDFTAHITYSYVSSQGSTDERTVTAMERLGLPVFQGGLSTVLGVMVLGFVDSYLISVFFKTIVLVICFGMLHALVFLPVTLSVCMPVLERCARWMHSKTANWIHAARRSSISGTYTDSSRGTSTSGDTTPPNVHVSCVSSAVHVSAVDIDMINYVKDPHPRGLCNDHMTNGQLSNGLLANAVIVTQADVNTCYHSKE